MSDDKIREDAVRLVLAVWRKIDHSGMANSRRAGIYDELTSKIRSAALTSDLRRFVDSLCKKWDVRSLSDSAVIRIIEKGDHSAILDTLRNETTMIVLMLRVHQEAAREKAQREAEQTKATLDATFGKGE